MSTIKVRIRSVALSSITLRLAEALTVRDLSSDQGRLLYLRVIGQNSVIVNFPTSLRRNAEITLRLIYSGRLEPQQIDREGVVLDPQGNVQQEDVYIPVEPQYIYSNRNYWYPQSTVTDYATSRLRDHRAGRIRRGRERHRDRAARAGTRRGRPGQRARKLYVFEADRPMRYLACVISRFTRVASREISIPAAGDRSASTAADADRRGQSAAGLARPRARSTAPPAILEFYGGLIGEAPYPELHAGADGERSAGRPQPGLLRHPQPAAADSRRSSGGTIR